MKKFTKLIMLMVILLSSTVTMAQCDYTIELYDSWGDGWNGGVVSVFVDGSAVLTDVTISAGSFASYTFTVTEGAEITTVYVPDGYPGENSYSILSSFGFVVWNEPPTPGDIPPGALFATCLGMGDIEGHVFNGDGLAINDVLVNVVGITSTRTDPSGYYILVDVPAGLNDIVCSKTGYNTITTSGNVVPFGIITLDVTLTQPNITVSPLLFDEVLHPNEYLTKYLGLLNTGSGPFDWTATVLFPPSKSPSKSPENYPKYPLTKYDTESRSVTDPHAFSLVKGGEYNGSRAVGDILNQWPSGLGMTWGAGCDGSHVYITDPTGVTTSIYQFDLYGNPTGTTFTVSVGQSWIGDMASDGTYLYALMVGGPNDIQKIEISTGNIVGTIGNAAWTYTSQRGLAYDADNDEFYVGGWNSDVIWRTDNTGAVISQTAFPDLSGLAWHPQGGPDGNGSLWTQISAAPGVITEVDPNNGWAALQNFNSPDNGCGLALNVDGSLWVPGMYDNVVYLIDTDEPITSTGWLTLDDYSGTVLPGGGTFNIGTNFDASGTMAGEVYTADILLTTSPFVGEIIIPVTMTIGGDPFPSVSGFTAELTSQVTGEATLNWNAVRTVTLDYYMIYRDGTPLTTVDASTTSYIDMLPAFGAYDYEVQPIFVEGQGIKEGPETVEWFEPALCWDPMNPENTQWPEVEEEVMLELENCGSGELEFSFPDYAVTALLSDPTFVPNETSWRAPSNGGDEMKGKDDQYNGQGNPVNRGAGGPDAFGYVWIDSDEIGGPVYNWIDISATGTLVTGLADDNVVGPFPMGFVFPFYGEDKTEFWVNSNGSIGFTSTYITLSNYAIPTGNSYVDLIAWFWDDMNPTTGASVYYEDFGNYLVIQFDNYAEYGSSDYVDAQMIIKKNGSVIINYDYIHPDLDILSNTIGMQSSDNSVGLQVSYNTSYLHDGLAVYMGPPGDHFVIDVNPFYGVIPEGETLDVTMTYSSEGYEVGDYYEDVAITTNEQPNFEWFIPNTMYVESPAIITGQVTDCVSGAPIESVTILAEVDGSPEIYFTTETAENGTYELYVNEETDYIISATRPGYIGQVVAEYVEFALVVDFDLCEEPYAVPFVLADPNEADTECMVTWALPMGPYLIAYDDGTADDYFAWIGPGGMSAVKFTPAGYPATVQGARLFVGDGSFPEGGDFIGTSMEIMVFDDDGADGMPGTALDSLIITVNDYGWVEVTGLRASFTDGDFYVVYRQLGFSPNVAPIGIDESIPVVYRSYVKTTTGDWMVSSYQDMMIRAIVSGPGENVMAMSRAPEQKVYPGKLNTKKYIATSVANGMPGIQGNGSGSFIPVISDMQTRDLDNYTVARASNFDPTIGPETGTLTPIANPTTTFFNDIAFGGLDDGFYAYAVKAVYGANESIWVYSNIVAHGLDNVATFNVSQCDGLSPEGAVVNIIGQDYPWQDLAITVDESGIAVFDSVINGTYDLTVTKLGYTTYVHNDLYIYEDYTEDVILVEVMYPARKLSVTPLTSVATWRSPYTEFLANQGFDEGTDFPPAGWQATSLGAGWEHTDDGSSDFWTIPPGDGWYAVANDDAAGSGSNGCCDYLIMPEMDLTETDGLLVQFDAFMNGAYGQTATVEYSTNGGASWTVAMDIPIGAVWTTYQTDLDMVAGEESVLVAFHANDNGGWASGLAMDNVSAFWGTEPTGYVVSLDGGFVSETAADVTTYAYQNLVYGQTYVAEVRAKYSCGTSDPIFYTFTSNYLYPPRNLMDEYVYNTNEVPLFWNPPITVAGPMLSNVNNSVVDGRSNYSVKSAPKVAGYENIYTPENLVFKNGRDGHTAYFIDIAADELYSMNMLDYSYASVGPTVIDPSTGDFMNGDLDVWYTTGNWGSELYSVDVATGTATFIANITGAQDDVGGMACDRATNTMYISWTNISQSGIGTIDLETGVVTPIGSATTVAPGLIDIAIDGDGQMYGWGIVNDASYTIDKATGEVTMLGSLGVDLNYGQGGNWDSEDDVIYMTAYVDPGGPQLLVLDRETGGTTVVESLFGQCTAFGVPGTGGGGGGGNVPAGLYSFNVYRDGGFIAEVLYEGQGTEDWVTYVDNNLMPGCYVYDVTAVYDLTDFGFPGEFGESDYEGPDEVCIVWGTELPFCEDWSVGTFEHNGWTVSGDNWEISSDVGTDAPSAQWNWDPDPGSPYVSSLTSSPFNADMLSEGNVMLDFDIKLNDRISTGEEMMTVEVYDGNSWYTVASFDNAEGSFDFTSYQFDITTYAMTDVFQIRFSAEGVNSFDVIAWNIDNICVYRVCTPPFNLTGEYMWNATDDLGAEICWEAVVGPSSSQWFYYDDESIEYVWGSTTDWDADVAIKIPVEDLVDFAGAAVTQYRAFVDSRLLGVGTVSVKVYQGENPDPSVPMYVEDVTDQFVAGDDWNDFIFSEAVMIDNTQPLWIGMYFTGPADTYGPGITEDMGVSNPNGELYWEAGQWVTLEAAGINNRAWLLRGFVTTTFSASMGIASNNVTPLPISGLETAGLLSQTSASISIDELNSSRELTVFNVYRMGDGATEYELIASVPSEEGATSYCYFDTDIDAQAGYYYQVTATYEGATDYCESAPAMAAEEPLDDFVYVFITGLGNQGEFFTNLYPNPAQNIVTVTSSIPMTQLTVTNYVGQVVYTDDMNGSTSHELNTSSYQPGVYLVKIDTENGVVTKRVIITK